MNYKYLIPSALNRDGVHLTHEEARIALGLPGKASRPHSKTTTPPSTTTDDEVQLLVADLQRELLTRGWLESAVVCLHAERVLKRVAWIAWGANEPWIMLPFIIAISWWSVKYLLSDSDTPFRFNEQTFALCNAINCDFEKNDELCQYESSLDELIFGEGAFRRLVNEIIITRSNR